MISIDDPEVLKTISECKGPKYQPQPALEPLDTSPCEHDTTFDKCIKCQFADSPEETWRELARSYYVRFSQPCRMWDYRARPLLKELEEKRQKEILTTGRGLVNKAKAGNVDTLIYYLDDTFEHFPDPDRYQIILHLYAIIYNKSPVKLTKEQESDLLRMRTHVFYNQLRALAKMIDYRCDEKLRGKKWGF